MSIDGLFFLSVQVEVNLALERSPDMVVGIEVKASATVHPEDFRGLARLRKAAGPASGTVRCTRLCE